MATCRVESDVALHVDDLGSPTAPHTVVLIHGQAGSYKNWMLNAERLADESRVVVPELRGHRHSTTPDDADMSMSRLAADIVEILDQLGIASAHIVGWSLGGLVAQELAFAHPNRVETLALVNTFHDWSSGAWYRRYTSVPLAVLAQRVAGRAPRRLLRRMAPAFARKVIQPETRRRHPELMAVVTADFAANLGSPCINRLTVDTTARFSSTAWLPTLALPVLVVAGRRDHVPFWMTELMFELLPNAELAVWGDGSHMVPMDDPEGFNNELLDFVRRAGAGETVAGSVRQH